MAPADLIRQLTREVRAAAGIERTPDEIRSTLVRRFRFPEEAVQKILRNRDATAKFAHSLRFGWAEKLPSSEELMDHRWG